MTNTASTLRKAPVVTPAAKNTTVLRLIQPEFNIKKNPIMNKPSLNQSNAVVGGGDTNGVVVGW